MFEAAGTSVINTGISFFNGVPEVGYAHIAPLVGGTRGAILATVGAVPSANQLQGIGIKDVVVGALVVNGSIARRYPKSVTIPDVGRSVARYYYVVTNVVTPRITLLYDNKDAVGNESSMKVYIENANNGLSSTDAFSNSEELKGTTMVTPSSEFAAGFITATNFEVNSGAYGVTGKYLNPGEYLLSFASLPGGGTMKI
jgi:hypothetical protein